MTDKGKMPPLYVRAGKFLHAVDILTEKGIGDFKVPEVVAEIDQRRDTHLGNPQNYRKVVESCAEAGVIQCTTPERGKHKRWKVGNQRHLDTYLAQLNGDTHDVGIAIRALDLSKVVPKDIVMPTTDEFECVEVEEEVTVPVHTNGRKKVGWFKRWFTNAEIVEELRETNSRLERILEVWK